MSLLSDFLARLLGQSQEHAEPAERPHPASGSATPHSDDHPMARSGEHDSPTAVTPADWRAPAARTEEDAATAPNALSAPGPDEEVESTSELTLDRMEAMITDTMGYGVQRHAESGHPCLLGTWDSYPFVIEIPDGHEGWLLVSGDWEEPVGEGMRDELAASVNDWNRDKFFPTVSIIDSPSGSMVRATYLIDLSAGVTDIQLRLHLETALSSCTQALSLVRPLLPEL